MSNCLSPFRWKEYPRPSIFVTDSRFTGTKTTGKTMSQTSSEAVERITRETGRNPGSIMGISAHADRLVEQGNAKRFKEAA